MSTEYGRGGGGGGGTHAEAVGERGHLAVQPAVAQAHRLPRGAASDLPVAPLQPHGVAVRECPRGARELRVAQAVIQILPLQGEARGKRGVNTAERRG